MIRVVWKTLTPRSLSRYLSAMPHNELSCEISLSLLLGAALLAGACAHEPLPGVQGAYRLSDGRLVSVRASAEDTVRYRVFESGESRRLHPTGEGTYVAGPGFDDREPVTVRVRFVLDEGLPALTLAWEQGDGGPLAGRRVNRQEAVTFTSDGVRFSGRLDLPEGAGPYPALVLVHGSGTSKATDYFHTGDFLAAHGIATLTYDKRGTGDSAFATSAPMRVSTPSTSAGWPATQWRRYRPCGPGRTSTPLGSACRATARGGGWPHWRPPSTPGWPSSS